MRKFSWKALIIGIGIAAQLAVPVWMLTKRHLILTRGERVTLRVSLYDPRDLFMGHYVRLSAVTVPLALEGVPQNYLRYYCDQRYARPLERLVAAGGLTAELDVRVWRGSALAEELRINGIPAYDYMRGNTAQAAATAAPRPILWEPESPMLWALANDWDRRETVLGSHLTDATHLLLRIPDPILLHTLAEPLGLTLPATVRPVTPKETEAFRSALNGLRRWLEPSVAIALPLFTGLPEGIACDKPFAEQAKAYYEGLRELCPDRPWFEKRGRRTFYGIPPEDRADEILDALRTAFPEAEWLPADPAKGDVPVLHTFAAPVTDLTAAQAVALAENPEAAITPERREAIIAALIAELLRCRESAADPASLDALLDELLLCLPERALWKWFEVCPNYDAYRCLLRDLRTAEARGLPVFLGGWNAVRDPEGDPPVPPKPRLHTSSADLLGLARRIPSLAPPAPSP